MRLFRDAPKWVALYRSEEIDKIPIRGSYMQQLTSPTTTSAPATTTAAKPAEDNKAAPLQVRVTESATNGTSYVVQSASSSLANYPHVRRVNGMLYVSGLSSRRPDNTLVGAERQADGTYTCNIALQTKAVLEHLQAILQAVGADLSHVVDITTYLVDMKHYTDYNNVYNSFFKTPETAPTRTTVAVHQLPNPNILIEIKAVAAAPTTTAK